MTSEGSEFHTDGAEHRKACFASNVLVNGMVDSGVSDERNARVDSQYSTNIFVVIPLVVEERCQEVPGRLLEEQQELSKGLDVEPVVDMDQTSEVALTAIQMCKTASNQLK